VTWNHVATQLRIVGARMVREGRLLPASTVLGFVAAVEQHLIGFSSSAAESAFKGKPMALNTSLIEYLEKSLNGRDQYARNKK
jgi:hypothetical protein